MKKFYVLIGPPSVGKSTWIKNNIQDPYVISRDEIVENVAGSRGMTYDNMFIAPPADAKLGDKHPEWGVVIESPDTIRNWQPLSYSKIADANNKVAKLFNKRVKGAVPSGRDIVVDMTNMNVRSRTFAMKYIKGHESEYYKVAVVFNFKGIEDIIIKVAQKRSKETGKFSTSDITSIYNRMYGSYQEPTKEEGFDEIIYIDNSTTLKGLITESKIIKKFKDF